MDIVSEIINEDRVVILTGFNESGKEITEKVRIPADGTPVTLKNIFWPPKSLKETEIK